MIDQIANKYFYLHNGQVSYLFYVMENGQLGHLYYGKDLGKLTSADLKYMNIHDNKSSGTVKYSPEINNFSLADRMQEYPVYGTSDFREGALSIECQDEVFYPNFVYQDYEITDPSHES